MQFIINMRRCVLGSVLVLSQLVMIPTTIAAPTQLSTLRNLSSFLTKIERQHPQLKISQAKLSAANARTRAASQPLYNPEIEIDAERIGFHSSNVDTVTVGVKQTLDWHDKRSARKNISHISQKIMQYEQQSVSQQLIANVFSALADYHAQREIIQAHNKRALLAKQVFVQATRLQKAGEISKLELEQTRLSQSKNQLLLNQARIQLSKKAQALVAVSGIAQKTWPILPYAPPKIQEKKLSYDQILAKSSVLKAAQIRITKARSILRLRVREQKQDPTIGLRVGGEDSEKVIGLTLSIPLNVRNNYGAEVDEARANIRRDESIFENSKYLLKIRLRSAVQTYQLTYSSWQSWQKIAGISLKKQSHLLMRLWKAGELSTSDYLLQLNQIKEAELNNVELKSNVWKAWFNWLATSNQFKPWLNGKIR